MVKYEAFTKISLIVLATIIITVLLIKRFVYFKPSAVFVPYKETYKDVSEGNIHGWFVQGQNDKVVLICHGNAGNISHRQHLIDSLHKLGYSVLIFDYAGYGRSRGIPSEMQFYQDASVFANIAMRKFDKNNIIVYGESIGAAVAAHITRKYQFKTLIIDSGLPSIKKYIKCKVSFLGFMSFVFSEFNTEEYLQGCRANILVLHSINDEIIPYHITEVVRKYAKLVINIHGTHNNRIIPWEELDKFITQSCQK